MPRQPFETLSPLRYPGSKRKLAPAICALIKARGVPTSLFVEPFCGGASVALRLLHAQVVERVVLADLDPLTAAFWWTSAYDHEWLIKVMMKEPVTLARFDYWRRSRPRSVRQRALKCLFLNRTSFSGILHDSAGPIGGRAQTGDYRIDCRFRKDGLAARIETIARLARDGRIAGAWHSGWSSTLHRLGQVEHPGERLSTLVYLDPPYVEKAERLYGTGFSHADHQGLATQLAAHGQRAWILSYDDVESIRAAYMGLDTVQCFRPVHHYTASGSRDRLTPGRELLFTNFTPGGECRPGSAGYR